MDVKSKIVLVAKPWKGGLGRYVYLTLAEMFPGQVEWIFTCPRTIKERMRSFRDKTGWRRGLVRRIESVRYTAAIFINHLPEFEDLAHSSNYILWLTDGPRPQVGELAPYGRIFLSDPGYRQELTAAVGEERYAGELGLAFYPPIHKPVEPLGSKKDLCFIGNRDQKRDAYLSALFQAGMAPSVVGNYFLRHSLFWQHPSSFRPAVSNERMGRVYAGHSISLNILAKVIREGTNMRTFECAGYGIPQLVEYSEGIENYFEPGREIIVYSSPDEMVDKAKRLLTDRKALITMAERARSRALAEHTYKHRIARMLDGLL
jgi:hypothetical protein